MATLLVSVFCDVYNHEPYLRDCFEDFVMQKCAHKILVTI
jgi:GTPase